MSAAEAGIGVEEWLKSKRRDQPRSDAYAQRSDFDGVHGVVPARPGKA